MVNLAFPNLSFVKIQNGISINGMNFRFTHGNSDLLISLSSLKLIFENPLNVETLGLSDETGETLQLPDDDLTMLLHSLGYGASLIALLLSNPSNEGTIKMLTYIAQIIIWIANGFTAINSIDISVTKDEFAIMKVITFLEYLVLGIGFFLMANDPEIFRGSDLKRYTFTKFVISVITTLIGSILLYLDFTQYDIVSFVALIVEIFLDYTIIFLIVSKMLKIKGKTRMLRLHTLMHAKMFLFFAFSVLTVPFAAGI